MRARGGWAVVQHVPFEGPALIADALREAGHRVAVHRMWEGDPLPAVDALDGLVVLGGPMGALDDAAHPYLKSERELLASAVAAGLPVLGVCLGAQLLAVAHGAPLHSGATHEVGTGTVTLTPEAAEDPVFVGVGVGPDRMGTSTVGTGALGTSTTGPDPMGAGTTLPVVHWHEDIVGLPAGATLLAHSPLTPVQAFRIGPRAYGFQFHVETDRAAAAGLRPHLPAGTELPDAELESIAATGRRLLRALVATTTA